jgi:hypothetical protein
MQRINLQRPSFLLPFLLAFLARADFAAEKTRFDLQQLKAPPGFHISVFAENIDGAHDRLQPGRRPAGQRIG